MSENKHRYESEVRLGLLAIVFVLVFLNFASLFIVYRARTAKEEETTLGFASAAIGISRELQQSYPQPLTESRISALRERYKLTSLFLTPSRPPISDAAARRKWFVTVAQHLPPDHLNQLADKLISADLQAPTRGEGDEYLYLYPVPARAGTSLLIVGRPVPGLAYLDDAGETILIIGFVSLGIVGLVYLLLSRVIFAPFERLRSWALKAGRSVGSGSDDVESLIADYERVIDELRQSEAQLKDLNAEISDRADSLKQFNNYLLRAIDSGMITLSNDGIVQIVNQAACRVLNVEPDEFTGKTYRELLRGCPDILRDTSHILSQERGGGYAEYTIVSASGDIVVLGVSISAIRNANGQRLGLSLLFTDLTEITNLQKELQISNKLASLGEMAGGLAHQLRNSMGVISGYATLVKKRLLERGESVESIEAMASEIQDAGDLVSQFLTFARPFDYMPLPCHINELVEEVVEMFRVRGDCDGIHFAIQHAANIEIEADPLLLKQAIINLVENAVHATEAGRGTVSIRSSLSSDGLDLSVMDSGCGIDSELREQIFTPFFSTSAGGSGLGLPLVRKIIDAHRGRVSYQSVPGRGTTFTISLPLRAQPVADEEIPVNSVPR